MNRKLLVFLLFVVVGIHSIGQKKSYLFHVQGKIIGRDTGLLVLRYLNDADKLVRDSTFIKGGMFEFAGKINQPTYASLVGKKKFIDFEEANYVAFFLEEGNINVELREDTFKDAIISGSKEQEDYKSFLSTINQVQKKYEVERKALLEVKKLYIEDTTNHILKKRFDSLYNANLPGFREVDSASIDFIEKHPDSYISAYMLYPPIRTLPVERSLALYNRFTDRIKKSRYGIWAEEEIGNKQKSSVNVFAPNFVRKGFNGERIELTSFAGKSYVLLDFWASWCIPCRKYSEQLRSLFAKYYFKGFNIVSISCERDTIAWKKAIKEDGLTAWHHVLEDKSPYQVDIQESEQGLREQYNVQPIPTFVLINKEGKIVARYTGIDDEGKSGLESKLLEVFR